MARVLVPLFDGFEEIEALTVIDVLRRGGVEVVTASLGKTAEVKAAHGVTVRADTTLAALGAAEYAAIVMPGGPGTAEMFRSMAFAELLSAHVHAGRLVAAICAAPTVLTRLGLVPEDCHVTCYPSCAGELGRPVAEAPVVEDGPFITGEAPGAAMLFALVVLKRLKGEETAAKVAQGMVTDVLG